MEAKEVIAALIAKEVIAALITAGAGLVGVLVGSMVSWLTTYTMEKRRWAREDARRFDIQRRQVYVAFLGAIAKLQAYPPEAKELAEARVELRRALAEIELVASPKVHLAAHGFAMVVSDQIFNPHSKEFSSDDWFKSRQKLLDEVRAELGLPPPAFGGG